MEEFVTLNDYLQQGLDIVFVGLNPSRYSVEVGHYFANPRNRFWAALNRSGLVSRAMTPQDDAKLPDFGIGFTDVIKRPTRQGSVLRAADYRRWIPALIAKLLEYNPHIVCFQGVMGYGAYMKYTDGVTEKIQLGLQQHQIGASRVFVVPNPSPANAQYSLDDLVYWYKQLGDLRAELIR